MNRDLELRGLWKYEDVVEIGERIGGEMKLSEYLKLTN
jgi:hypothetical protein